MRGLRAVGEDGAAGGGREAFLSTRTGAGAEAAGGPHQRAGVIGGCRGGPPEISLVSTARMSRRLRRPVWAEEWSSRRRCTFGSLVMATRSLTVGGAEGRAGRRVKQGEGGGRVGHPGSCAWLPVAQFVGANRRRLCVARGGGGRAGLATGGQACGRGQRLVDRRAGGGTGKGAAGRDYRWSVAFGSTMHAAKMRSAKERGEGREEPAASAAGSCQCGCSLAAASRTPSGEPHPSPTHWPHR